MAATRLKDRKRQAIVSKVIGSIFCLIGIVVTCAFVIRLPLFTVQGVEVVGNKVIEKSEVEYVVRSIADKYYFGVMPVATALFYPKEKILQAIVSSSPRIETATLALKNGVALVTVAERQIYALWCRTETDCFLLDGSGLIFAEAPVMEGSSLLRYVGGISSSTSIRLGMQYVETKEAFLDIRFLLNELESKGIEIAEVHIDPIGSISVISKNKTTFLIGRRDDFSAALSRLEATFADPTVPVQALYREGKLETLDVRFLGKALFKERK